MNTLEAMGNAQFLALEGRRQIALAIAAWMKPLLRRAMTTLRRQSIAGRSAP